MQTITTKLLSIGTDPKTAKSNKVSNYLTAIQYLIPGGAQCLWASKGCLKGCLHTAGNPLYLKGKTIARKKRTALLRSNFVGYMAKLFKELKAFERKCKKLGKKPAVRLNGTSDISWELIAPEIFSEFPKIQFYDYTKSVDRVLSKLPKNYDLTFSRSETNQADCLRVLENGGRVAMVFDTTRTKSLRLSYFGFDIQDGDTHDLTFLRKPGILGLRAKGKARKDTSGFVIRTH